MNDFKNILVVIHNDKDPENDPALARAVALAKRNNARLTLMDVIASPKAAISEYRGIFKAEELTAMLVARREETLNNIGQQIGKGIDLNIKVVIGRDFIEIVRQIVIENHDLLIKVANKHADGFDSSDFHLMRKCPQPVWLLKPEDQSQSRKILAAIDLSLEGDEEGQELNASIMNLATSLAQWENSELHVLSCWSLYGESSLRDSGFMKISQDDVAGILQEEELANRNRQNALVSRYKDCDIHAHLIKGHPVDHIPAFTRDRGIDIVVMGTVARSGIPGLLIGNTSETILHLIDSSVITLKPSGFESLIK